MAPAPMPRLPPHVLSRTAAWSAPLPAPALIPLPPGFADRAKARLVRDGLAEDVYYAGVVDFGGDFYNSGQDQVCERCCCR